MWEIWPHSSLQRPRGPLFNLVCHQILYPSPIFCNRRIKTGTSLRPCTSLFQMKRCTWVSFHLFKSHVSFPGYHLSIHILHPFLFFSVFFFLMLNFDHFTLLVCCSLSQRLQLFVIGVSVSKSSEPGMTGWGARPSLLPFPDGEDQRTCWPLESSEHRVAMFTCFKYTFTRFGHGLEPQLADVKYICGTRALMSSLGATLE